MLPLGNDEKEVLKVIGGYSKALDLLDDYDYRTLLIAKSNQNQKEKDVLIDLVMNFLNNEN